MGKYSKYEFRKVDSRPWEIHPVWRGIGCAMMVLIPIMAYAGAVLLVRANLENRWVPVPQELTGWVNFAPLARLFPDMTPFLVGLGRIYYLDLLLTFALTLLGFGLLTTIYAFLHSASGGSRYGPTDAPPIKKSPRRNPR
jgi:hypothetical protein